MKITVIGSDGMLGQDMVIVAKTAGHIVSGIDINDADITKLDSISMALKNINPDIVINCAAYTAVDLCEEKTDIAYAVNADGVANIATVAKELDIPVVHISTDYVFDGESTQPYIETDKTNPQSVYGKSKLAGEERLMEITDKYYIMRIAWLFGEYGPNFVKTILKLAKERDSLKVVSDQFGSPTWTVDVCVQIIKVLENGEYGIYHSTSEGECSWFEFTSYILEKYGVKTELLPCATSEFPRPAPRPANSVLNNFNLIHSDINIMPDWRTAFDRYVESERSNAL